MALQQGSECGAPSQQTALPATPAPLTASSAAVSLVLFSFSFSQHVFKMPF